MSKPKVPKNTKKKAPILRTARDDAYGSLSGNNKLRVDLNQASSTPYGSGLVIPT